MRGIEHGRVYHEASAALHFWYAIHRGPPDRYRHLVARALRFLPPMPKPLRMLHPIIVSTQPEMQRKLDEADQRLHAISLDCLLTEPTDDATFRARLTPVHAGPPFDDAYTDPMRERTNALVEHLRVTDNHVSTGTSSIYTGDCVVRRFSKAETTAQLRRAVTRLAALQRMVQANG